MTLCVYKQFFFITTELCFLWKLHTVLLCVYMLDTPWKWIHLFITCHISFHSVLTMLYNDTITHMHVFVFVMPHWVINPLFLYQRKKGCSKRNTDCLVFSCWLTCSIFFLNLHLSNWPAIKAVKVCFILQSYFI